MLFFSYFCWSILAVVTIIQLRYHHVFLNIYRNPAPRMSEESLVRVGVMMTLRGADPFLGDCLRKLFAQNYPHHEIRIIIDHETDPAMQLVEQIRDELNAEHVSIEVLKDRSESCSLRMSSLLQGVSGFDKSVEIFAWLDADAMPHSDWLRDLVAPLADPQVGASSGIRWYLPQDLRVGTLARHMWNAGAFLQMAACRIGWGGSFAIHRSVFEECGLERKWSEVMFEDTLTSNLVTSHGYDLKYAGAVTMMNTETISFSDCLGFVTRQLFNVRMYHRAWVGLVVVGIIWQLALLGNAGLLIWSIATQNWGIFAGTALVSSLYGGVMAYMILVSEKNIQQHVKLQGVQLPRLSLSFLPAVFFAHVLLVGLWFAWRVREIKWRGIRYSVTGPKNVVRLNYQPYCPVDDEISSTDSL